MLSSTFRWSALAAAASVCPLSVATGQIHASAGAGASAVASTKKEAPYRVLDNKEGEWLDLVFPPARPLVRDPQAERIYALNTYGSVVVETDLGGGLLRTLPVPWGPVAASLWRPLTGDGEFLVVACRGNHVLVRIDLLSGAVDRVIPLPTEPADVVVRPETRRAFVSCAGAGVVVEVDVAAGAVVREYVVPSEEPVFLSVHDGDVLVAPMLSGNNSLIQTGEHRVNAGPDGVLDLEDPEVALEKLPDHDLFRITPGGSLVPVATDVGTVLFGVGTNPATGAVWQCGTEALNKDPDVVGEGAHRDAFVENRLAIVSLPDAGDPPVAPSTVLNLDDADPAAAGVQIDVTRTVGQPYALAFDAAGHGYVTGLLTDNVTQLDSGGVFVREWDVGSIPRGLLVDPAGERAWVYSWGTNSIEVYDLTPATPALLASVELGHDPTPEREALGRRIFFSAAHSLSNNASCATCHVEGGSDTLGWDISELPLDDKGPVITQTLRGIEDAARFHWRGERNALADFNPAFDALLGGAPLTTGPGSEFEAFEAYLMSLRQPANPFQDPRRIVNATLGFTTPDGTFHAGDAVRGQDRYFDFVPPGGFSCNDCHPLPTGSAGDSFLDEADFQFPRRNHFEVPGFQGLWRKEPPTLETVVFADGEIEERPTTGSALATTGLMDSAFELIAQAKDFTAFLFQVDSGIAPAVHRAWLLAPGGPPAARDELARYLIPQARARNADVGVFGTVDLGGGVVERRWYWDRVADAFVCDDTTVAPRDLDFFVAQSDAGTGSNVFVGLPVGMGAGFAVDYDRDQLFNGDEVALGTDPFDPDTDGDGDPDGHEVREAGDPLDELATSNDTTPPSIEGLRTVHANVTLAKIQFETDEPTRVNVRWLAPGASAELADDRFRTVHSVILRDLVAGALHQVRVTATDLGGNETIADLEGGVTTLDWLIPYNAVFTSLSSEVLEDSGGVLRLRVSGRAELKMGGPLAGRRLVVQAFVNGEGDGEHQTGTLSGADGITAVEVTANGLAPGDVVQVSVFALFDPVEDSASWWDMPFTAPENRALQVAYTGTGP